MFPLNFFGPINTGGGTYTDPGTLNVRAGTAYTYNSTVQTGSLAVPPRADVLTGQSVDNTTGTLTLTSGSNVLSGVTFGVGGTSVTGSATTGTGGGSTIIINITDLPGQTVQIS